jgi:hypothetical protein
MRSVKYLAIALLLGAVACDESTPVDPGQTPDPTTMQFKKGARYEYESYHTDAETGQRTDSTARRRTWTVNQESVVVQGRSNVAIFVDSVFSAGSFVSVADTVYLQQESNNDVYRYASLLPEFDLSGVSFLDLGRTWMHEARLNATSATWLVGGDTLAMPFNTGVKGVDTIYIAVEDNAVASAVDTLQVEGTKYTTTKTTHKLELKIFVLIPNPLPVGPTHVAINLKTESLNRTTWIAPALGAIAKEVRDGKVLAINEQGYNFALPIPGYFSAMTKVLATGN